jgi:phosphopantothenoylcysteine decarboxylase/phosphopantothenate--cysteine ligase
VFNADDNEAIILGADGSERHIPSGPKADVAHAVWDGVRALLDI